MNHNRNAHYWENRDERKERAYLHTKNMAYVFSDQIEVPDPNKIIITGIDKQKVGQFAAEVREKRPPEPYKGKGIKYDYEVIRRKEGKAGKGK